MAPVTKLAAGLARNTTAPAHSSASPQRPAGVRVISRLLKSAQSGSSRATAVSSVAIHPGAMEFSKRLLTEAHVAVAPGVGFGEEGEGFVRIALVENEQRLRQAARGVKKMLTA